MSTIADNVAKLRARVAEAARRAGVEPETIRLVAVTKTIPVEAIREAVAAGITAVGENRVQEAEAKLPEIGRTVEWHLVGHLQTNKAAKAVHLFDVIHSIDSMKVARAVSRHVQEVGRDLGLLVQVNTSGEESKFGVPPQEAPGLVEEMCSLPGIRIRGLMTIGPFRPDPQEARPSFHRLRKLAEKIGSLGFPGVEMTWLSMGMTGDFEVAIEEGANLIRVGTAIFGPRG